MKVEVFKLEITLGNDSMQTPDDIAGALRRLAATIERNQTLGAYAWDANGNSVGETNTVTRRV